MASCPPSDTIFVCDLSQICLPGFACSDADGNIASSTLTGGTLSGDTACFTPVEGDNTLTLICTDSCGAADTCRTTITVISGVPPEITLAAFDTVITCTVGDTVCIDLVLFDPDNSLSGTFSLGYINFDDSTACFVPGDTGGVYCGTVIITDSCGLADTAEACIFVIVNGPPVIEATTRELFYGCAGDSICISYNVTDPNNNVVLEELVFNPANAVIDTSNNTVCLVVPNLGCVSFIIRATDGCDVFDEDTITVCVIAQPVATCPGNFSQFVCDLGQICVPGFSALNADTVYVIGGTLSGNTVCFTPQDGNNTIILVAENECGVDVCTTIVNVDLNMNPKPECPDSRTVTVCTLNDPICVSGFSVSDDQDINLLICTLNGQPFALSNPFCFMPVAGANIFTLVCTDTCGASASCSFTIDVVVDPSRCEDSCAVISIEKHTTRLRDSMKKLRLQLTLSPTKWAALTCSLNMTPLR